MAKADLIFQDRMLRADGSIIEMTIWRVPNAVPPTAHGFKYSLFYGRPGECIVGYDNERGKGDHRHYRGLEETYEFVGPEQLIADFLTDVEAVDEGDENE